MIKNIIFDMGEVLIHFDRDAFLDRHTLSDEDRAFLLKEVFMTVEWVMMDRGSLDEERLLTILKDRIPERLSDVVYSLVMEWDKPILPIQGMKELVRDLKEKGYHIFLLSNASVRQHQYWPRIPGSEYFEDTLISADYRLIKPQPEIFEAAFEKFGVIPEECVFIDDSPLNIEAAINAGMKGIVFYQNMEELLGKLRELGVRI